VLAFAIFYASQPFPSPSHPIPIPIPIPITITISTGRAGYNPHLLVIPIASFLDYFLGVS
jgi:hypothetical protein